MTRLYSISVLLVLLLAAVSLQRAGEESQPQEVFFQKIKSSFKHFHQTQFSAEGWNYVNPKEEEKGAKVDSITYQKLFRQSRIFTHYSGVGAAYYSFTRKKGYYQLAFAGKGHYVPDIMLLHYSPDGKLVAEQVVASAFFDAGEGRATHSVIQGDSLLIRVDLILDERPPGVPCDSTVTTFKIDQNGRLTQTGKKRFKMKCR